MYSVTAENSRDARQGEDLIVTRAPHGGSNWLTEAGKSDCAVCIPHTAVLAVQLSDRPVRGAWFEQARFPDASGHRDFLNYIDGEKERAALSTLPVATRVRVLHLYANAAPVTVPTVLESGHDEELVGAGAADRRGGFSRFFR